MMPGVSRCVMVVPVCNVRTLLAPACHEFLKHLANASRSDATSFDGPFSHLRWTCLSTLRGKFLFCGKPEPKS